VAPVRRLRRLLNDNCVPVGGFINGIRPVNLADDVLAAAATATPIDQGGPQVAEPMAAERPVATDGVWSLSTTDGIPDAPVTVVQAGVPQLCPSCASAGASRRYRPERRSRSCG
jgi:hypothetical protein